MDAEVTAPLNALDLACSDVARALLLIYVGDAQQALVRVSPHVQELAHTQWLVTHQDERFRPETRVTIDRIYELTRPLQSLNWIEHDVW